MARLRLAGRGASTPFLLIAIVAVALLLANSSTDSIRSVATQAACLSVLAVGLYIFVGNSGVLSFGHMGFAIIGGYVGSLFVLPTVVKGQTLAAAPSWIVNLHASPFVATLIAGAVAALFAVVVAVPLMRIAGLTAGLATFALLMVVHVVALNLNSVTNGSQGLFPVPVSTTLWVGFGWLAATIVVAFLYQRSRFGLLLRTAREEENAAAGIGVRIAPQRGLAFVISAFFTGVGGALYAMCVGTMSPDLIFLPTTLIVLSMVVIGGMTSLSGAVIGALFVSVLREVLDRAEEGSVLGIFHVPARPGLSDTLLAVVFILLLILRPAGIMAGRELTLPRLPRRGPRTPAPPAPVEDAMATTAGQG
jgi:branched-chain amino acid transport system permease protein